MVTTVASAMEPPDVAFRMPVGKCVQHREDWSCADPCADQKQGCVGVRVENESSARRGNLELVTNTQAGVEISARGAIVLALDTDPVIARSGRPAERVIAQDGFVLMDLYAHRQVLAGAGSGQRSAVGIVEPDRDNGGGLPVDRRHGQCSETGPCRGRAGCAETDVAAAAAGGQESLERGLPAGAERWDPERSFQ